MPRPSLKPIKKAEAKLEKAREARETYLDKLADQGVRAEDAEAEAVELAARIALGEADEAKLEKAEALVQRHSARYRTMKKAADKLVDRIIRAEEEVLEATVKALPPYLKKLYKREDALRYGIMTALRDLWDRSEDLRNTLEDIDDVRDELRQACNALGWQEPDCATKSCVADSGGTRGASSLLALLDQATSYWHKRKGVQINPRKSADTRSARAAHLAQALGAAANAGFDGAGLFAPRGTGGMQPVASPDTDY